jgi:hypothetical protein
MERYFNFTTQGKTMYTGAKVKIQDELYSNEVLLWSGQPSSGIRFRASDLFVIPFSLLWGGFACFWEGSVISHGISFFALWGIPFVLVGNYMVWGRFLVDAWQRSNSFYAVTNQRIIIISGLLNRKVKSLNLNTLFDISMDQKSDGSGTITFGPSQPFSRVYIASWPGVDHSTPSFEMIAEVKEVYKIIHDVQHGV